MKVVLLTSDVKTISQSEIDEAALALANGRLVDHIEKLH
jgi:hypothetical protein